MLNETPSMDQKIFYKIKSLLKIYIVYRNTVCKVKLKFLIWNPEYTSILREKLYYLGTHYHFGEK
jgi:hypothetical protein